MHATLRKFLDILQAIGPSILAISVPSSVPFIPKIMAAIADAQQIPGAAGPEKKAYVLGVIEKAIDVHNGLVKTPMLDSPLLLSTVSSGIDVVVGAVKFVQGLKVVTDVSSPDSSTGTVGGVLPVPFTGAVGDVRTVGDVRDADPVRSVAGVRDADPVNRRNPGPQPNPHPSTGTVGGVMPVAGVPHPTSSTGTASGKKPA